MRKSKHKVHRNKKLTKECWNLNDNLFRWLEERLPVYKKDASKYVDLEQPIIKFKGQSKNLEEWLDVLIEMMQKYKYIDSINIHELEELEGKTVAEIIEDINTNSYTEEEVEELKAKDKEIQDLIENIFELLGVLFPYLWW